ncbi:MAG: hypothetical protein V4697_02495 [Patescibacteria group bacterium]
MHTTNDTDAIFLRVLENSWILNAHLKGKAQRRMKYSEDELLVLAIVNKYSGLTATQIAIFLSRTLEDICRILLELSKDDVFTEKNIEGGQLKLSELGKEAYSRMIRDIMGRQVDLLSAQMGGRFPESSATLEIIKNAQSKVMQGLPEPI